MTRLPELDSDYHIAQDQVRQYQRDGHILLRNVCSKEEINSYRGYINKFVQEHAKTKGDLSQRDTYGKAFLQIGNLWRRDAIVKKFVFSRRLAQIAALLTMSPSIRLYHDQALYKEGHGGITPWHQDQFYWPLDTNQSLTMWMPLVDVSEEMGTMDFASGSHKKGYLGYKPISDQSESYFKEYINKQGFSIFRSGAMKAGDATFHNGWTLHGAAPNRSSKMREVITIIYYPENTKLIKPGNTIQQADFDAFYPGMKAGQIAASSLTPLLFSDLKS